MPKDIANENLFTKLHDAVSFIVEMDSLEDSYRLSDGLSNFLKEYHQDLKANPAALKRYEESLALLKLVHLFDLEDKDLINLISSRISDILSFQFYDLNEKFRQKLLQVDSLDERDKIKTELREALLRDKEKISSVKIKTESELREATVENWLKYYSSQVGIDKVDSLKFNQFLVNDYNVKLLEDSDKEKIKKLFSFFEKLKVSSRSTGGLEERFVAILPDKSIRLINHGFPEDINPQILKIYQEVAVKNYPSAVSKMAANDDDVLADEKPMLSKEPEASPNLEQSLPESEAPVTKIKIPRTTELEEILDSYSPASLEYKAISQEIMRLKKTEARKNAKR